MSDIITKLTIEGFKSIRKLEDFELRPLNVLIGANGAGKSNFVSFFRLLREMVEQRLQLALQTTEGGADGLLYMGPKVTQRFFARICFGTGRYEFAMKPTFENRLVFVAEEMERHNEVKSRLESGQPEAQLKNIRDLHQANAAIYKALDDVYQAISSWVVYHFHDTSLLAGVRRQKPINDNEKLRPDAENLASFLFRIRHTNPDCYNQIRDVARMAAPFFDDFNLRPVPTDQGLIQLEWRQRDSDYPFRAHQLSDGTLRFICLATALLQPEPPATMLFDEPELGLHPYALVLLGELFKQVPHWQRQVIISTQSAQLLNEFDPEDVVVVERHQGESTFVRLDPARLSEWLEEYSLGELWQKNVLGGRPSPENAPQLAGHGDGHS